jgi:HTH-type transcriptional regulator / antitoxin HigA
MTITLDIDNYPQLLAEFVPQAIDSEAEYDRALAIAERLTFKQAKTVAEIKFLKLIVVLIEDYETEHYPMDNVTPHELLQHLMESNHTRQADLVGLTKTINRIKTRTTIHNHHISPINYC